MVLGRKGLGEPLLNQWVVLVALWFAERFAFDANGVTAMAQPIEQGFHHLLVAEEVIPLGVVQVGGNDRGAFCVPLVHEFEEGVGLLWFEIQVAHFVNDQNIHSHQPIQEATLERSARLVRYVEEILSSEKSHDSRWPWPSGAIARPDSPTPASPMK